MQTRTPQQWREYRARRKAEGKPTKGGKKMGKSERGFFVAIDGEGADYPDGSHRYIILNACAQDGTQHTIYDANGLDGPRCLRFLIDLSARYPQAIFCVFSGGYDTVMMLKGLMTADKVKELWERAAMSHPDGKRLMRLWAWLIGFQPRKQLYIQDAATGVSITLWDVWGFFQASFVKTIEQWLPDYPDKAMISEHKAQRSAFDPANMAELVRYCQSECRALTLIMAELHARLEECGLRINRWDGAGAVASALLRSHGVKEHMAEPPQVVRDAATHAYFGGRIEALKYGQHTGAVYGYDINSAYPSYIRVLPSLRDGSGLWVRYDTPDTIADNAWQMPTFSMVYLEWGFDDPLSPPIYPFPYRTPLGEVLYPPSGRGWVWMPEYLAYLDNAHAYGGRSTVKPLEAITYQSIGDQPRPFAFVDELYTTRQTWLKEGKRAQIVLKLGLNSLYGKLAQQLGGERGKPPPFFQLEWAGFVTSSARAQLYRAAMQAPYHTIMLATDGIYATQPLTLDTPAEKELGKWEATEYDRAIIVQSGVYWLWKGEKLTSRTRGFSDDYANDRALTPERVLTAWESGASSLICDTPRTFVGFGPVAAGQRPFRELGTWVADTREIELYPNTKRWVGMRVASGGLPTLPHSRLEQSYPSPNPWGDRISAPHAIAWLGNAHKIEAILQSRRD